MSGHGSHAHPAPGVSIDYFSAGEGSSVVLVHGITESRRTWDPLVAPLIAAGHRVTAIDLRGHGASSHAAPYDLATMADDVRTVLEVEGISDALLIGHSLGGAVVSACAAAGSCRGVVNVDQPLALSGFQEALGQLRPMLQGDTASFRGAIGAMFNQMSGALVGSQRQRVDAIRSPDQDVVLGIWEMLFDSSAEELDATVDAMSGAITVPYLSVHGIDPGPGYQAWLTQRIPTAVVEVWPDLGHYPHLVEQQRFVDRVIEFDRSLA